MSARSLSSTDDKPIRSWVMIAVFGSIASILTVYHSLLHPDPLSVFYLILISTLFTLVVIFITLEISKNKNSLKHLSKTGIFLSIYILLIIWLGINKTIPEHNEILDFQKKRADLTYWIYDGKFDTHKKLAYLYMNASPSISRIEPQANHYGTKILRAYLENQINEGNGPLFAQEMYDLAEATFTYSSRELAHTWYKYAHEYGKAGAIQRYNERMVHFR
jgi:hypothetical protein